MNIPGTDKAWPVLLKLMGGHVAIYKRTGGRVGWRVPPFPPILLLDHKGAKSGVERTSPIAYIADGSDLVIIASKGGYPKNPAWYYNLLAHPDTKVQVKKEIREVHARLAEPSERDRLWEMANDAYNGFDGYQERTEREIPIIVLEPRPSA